MADEPVGPQSWLEVPDHDGPIVRGRDHLFQVGVESDAGDPVLVPFKGPFELWVSYVSLEPILLGSLFVSESRSVGGSSYRRCALHDA
jgi:hypothetical protein